MKKTYIEFLRIIACFFVIVNHTNSRIFKPLAPSPTWFCSVTAFLLSKTAVPLFLMIMGALLLDKEDSPKKTARRVGRIAAVLAVFSLAYRAYYAWHYHARFSLKEALELLPQTEATNTLWYLYLYLGLLLMLPLLQRFVKALDRGYTRYLLLISLGLPGAVPFIPDFRLNYYFQAALIGPYIGLVVLGYYVERYVPVTRRTFRCCFFGFVGLAAAQLALALAFYARDGAEFYRALEGSTLVTVTATAACVYVCVKYLYTARPAPERTERIVRALGALTFGIYLFGDMVINYTEPVYSALEGHMHALCAMVLWEALIFAIAALVTALLRRVPRVRKWI
ncbi:MAG: acyltransferase [Butyricicoccus sp.]|nr:acyltransferase [Butyricicoccus sp.]